MVIALSRHNVKRRKNIPLILLCNMASQSDKSDYSDFSLTILKCKGHEKYENMERSRPPTPSLAYHTTLNLVAIVLVINLLLQPEMWSHPGSQVSCSDHHLTPMKFLLYGEKQYLLYQYLTICSHPCNRGRVHS